MFFNKPIRERKSGVNVPPIERMASGGVGAAALAMGVRSIMRGSFFGWLLAATGTYLGVRAALGRCLAYRTMTRHHLMP